MGIIAKQTIIGSLWTYLGAIFGFITVTYLYTSFLTPEIVGLIGILLSFTTIFGRFSLLGIQGVTARFFPYFRNSDKQHNGFFFIATLVVLTGILLFSTVFLGIKDYLVEQNSEKSYLFSKYMYLLFPLVVTQIIFSFLDSYNRVIYNAVIGILTQELIQRILIMLLIVVYAFDILTLNGFVIGFVAVLSVKTLILIVQLYRKGEIQLKPKFSPLFYRYKKEMVSVGLYSILGSLGSLIVFNLDKIVINHLLGLSDTGVYTIAFFFGTLVVIPSRPLLKISGTLVADAWASNDRDKIKEIYYKSCINQLIIGGFLFLGIWINIDNIIEILGEDYVQSKWVIFFIGMGYLFDMSTGVNAQIIAYSKKYWVNFYFTLSIIVFAVVGLYFFITLWGIVGAAIAVSAALFINNLMRYIYLYRKYNLQPFKKEILGVLAVYLCIYFSQLLIPQLNLYLDIVIRGSYVVLLTYFALVVFPLSEDASKYLKIYTDKLLRGFKK